jgi:hypothetical protein
MSRRKVNVVGSFLSVTKYLREINLNEKKVCLGFHSFRSFSPWLLGLIVFRSVARQYIMVGACDGRKLLYLWWLGSKRELAHSYKKAPPQKTH